MTETEIHRARANYWRRSMAAARMSRDRRAALDWMLDYLADGPRTFSIVDAARSVELADRTLRAYIADFEAKGILIIRRSDRGALSEYEIGRPPALPPVLPTP